MFYGRNESTYQFGFVKIFISENVNVDVFNNIFYVL